MSQNVQLSDLTTGQVIYPETTISQVKNLQTTLNGLASKQDIEDAKEEILGEDLKETFETLKTVQEWTTKHGTEYANLLSDVQGKASQDDVDEISGSLNGVQSDLDDVQSDLSDVKGDISDVKGNISSIQSGLESKVSSETYEAKIASLESTIQSLTSRLATLENKEYSNVKYVAVAD